MTPVGRQMAIKKLKIVSIDFLSMFVDSIGVFDCRLPGVFTAQYIMVLATKVRAVKAQAPRL